MLIASQYCRDAGYGAVGAVVMAIDFGVGWRMAEQRCGGRSLDQSRSRPGSKNCRRRDQAGQPVIHIGYEQAPGLAGCQQVGSVEAMPALGQHLAAVPTPCYSSTADLTAHIPSARHIHPALDTRSELRHERPSRYAFEVPAARLTSASPACEQASHSP